MAAVRARSAATCLLMLQLHSVSNGPSGEPAAPTAEFIIVVSNVAASQCFEWTEWGACRADCGVYYCCFQCCSFTLFRMDRVGACRVNCGVYYCCFQCSSFAVLRMDRVYNITYIYRVYVDSHSLGQLALASKRIS